MRVDGRDAYTLRPVRLETGFLKYPEGSADISCGDTRIFCTASVDEKVPPFLKNTGTGWVTAEYAMLPRSTASRNQRDSTRGQTNGRAQEIQRLIGRALRSVVDVDKLGERTVFLDCDVVQADGGTRTAAITGAFVALALAVHSLLERRIITQWPLRDFVAAVSVGVVNGETLLDLKYQEDSTADVDMNVVATGSGRFVEIQGTAEREPFADSQLFEMLEIARLGIVELLECQREALSPRMDLPRLFPRLDWLQKTN